MPYFSHSLFVPANATHNTKEQQQLRAIGPKVGNKNGINMKAMIIPHKTQLLVYPRLQL